MSTVRIHAGPMAAVLAGFALVGAAYAAGQGQAFVTNQQGGVSVIDLATLEVTATFDVAAKGPRGLGVTDDGRWLVTANMGNENISVVDTATGALVRQIAIGKNPEFVRVLGTTAYVTYEPSPSTGGGPSTGGTKAAVSKDDKDDNDRVPGHIAVVDLKSGKTVLDIVGKPETEGMEFTRDGSKLVVTNESDNSLSVLDAASGRVLQSVSVAKYGERPRGIKASPDGSIYVVTLEMSGKMLVFDDKLQFVREVATGKGPYGVSFDQSGKFVFVAANKEKTLQVFDVATWEKRKDIPTGDRCWHFSFTPDERQILLACGKSNEVVVIDTSTLEVTKRIGGLKIPWGIVTFPRSRGSID